MMRIWIFLFLVMFLVACSPTGEKANVRYSPVGGDSNPVGGESGSGNQSNFGMGGSGGELQLFGGAGGELVGETCEDGQIRLSRQDFIGLGCPNEMLGEAGSGGNLQQNASGGAGEGGMAVSGGSGGNHNAGGTGGDFDEQTDDQLCYCLGVCAQVESCNQTQQDCQGMAPNELRSLCETRCMQKPEYVMEHVDAACCDSLIGFLKQERCEISVNCDGNSMYCDVQSQKIVSCASKENQCPNIQAINGSLTNIFYGLCESNVEPGNDVFCTDGLQNESACEEGIVANTILNFTGENRPLQNYCVDEDVSFVESVCAPACEKQISCFEEIGPINGATTPAQCMVACASIFRANEAMFECIMNSQGELGSEPLCQQVSDCVNP